MREFFCFGVDHHKCPVDFRERLAFSKKDTVNVLRAIRQLEGMRECFFISTCNRVELYGRGDEKAGLGLRKFLADFHQISESELSAQGYLLRGEAVFRHLFRLACGLESMVVGEYEIYGQLKRSFQQALAAGTLDSVLYQLVERSFRVGKRARSETGISRGAVSVASVAVELAEKIFGRLAGEKVLVLGTGEMSERAIENLTASGAGKIVVTSRSFDRALGLAQKFGAEPVRFDEWLRALRTSDIVITSTAAPHAVVRFEDVKAVMRERRSKPLFFVDIAVPRDVDPSVQTLNDVYLYDIDDLQSVSRANLRERKKEIEKCENLIASELIQFHGWLEQLDMRPVVQRVQRYLNEIAEEEIRRSGTQFQGKEILLRNLLTRVQKKMTHRPFRVLKQASREGTLPHYLQVIRELFSDEGSPRAGQSAPAKDKAPGKHSKQREYGERSERSKYGERSEHSSA